MSDSAITRAWITAGEDLGIEVVVPAVVTIGALTVRATALLPQFGPRNGIVVFGNAEYSSEVGTTLVQHGYGFSYVRGDAYDRDGFVAVLDDWGWGSTDPAPSWYRSPK